VPLSLGGLITYKVGLTTLLVAWSSAFAGGLTLGMYIHISHSTKVCT